MRRGLARGLAVVAILAGAGMADAQAIAPAPPIRAVRFAPPGIRPPEFMLRRRLEIGPLMPQWKAAELVRRTYPGARILRIRPGLRTTEFLVTLRMGSSLLRLRVNRHNGAIGI